MVSTIFELNSEPIYNNTGWIYYYKIKKMSSELPNSGLWRNSVILFLILIPIVMSDRWKNLHPPPLNVQSHTTIRTYVWHVPQDLYDVVGQFPRRSAFHVPPRLVLVQPHVLEFHRTDHLAAVRALQLHLQHQRFGYHAQETVEEPHPAALGRRTGDGESGARESGAGQRGQCAGGDVGQHPFQQKHHLENVMGSWQYNSRLWWSECMSVRVFEYLVTKRKCAVFIFMNVHCTIHSG